MKRKRRSIEVFSLSFLDVISCGFGAIVLLLVIMKISEPGVIEESTRDMTLDIEERSNEIAALRDQSAELYLRTEQLRGEEQRLLDQIAALNLQLAGAREEKNDMLVQFSSQEAILQQLYRARQDLTEEMIRLQQQKTAPPVDAPIGGVPVDSEYIIFVIDTSGSMQQFAWPAVRKKMGEFLSIYPRVKGIQVMNDMGDYMFSQYSGRWIQDSPARRKAILERLRTWTPFSNSSPVEGITSAIRRFYEADKKISIYVFGDDFSRGSIQEVVDTVDSINRSLGDGDRRVRIHAVGFPVLFGHKGAELNVARFSALMRRLAEDNDGSFVGLTEL
ncbi:MAG: VWA domain-containing protein [Desulfobulbaceae bacterium]|nr:MAG: VWA domain-containing protein [Desulfobulbaceae bacterium]